MKNELNREFNGQATYAVVVSDLTYVRINHQLCLLIDLYNREIIGHSVEIHKETQLVYNALATVKVDLRKIQMFHSDKGNQFKNKLMKGCPYDNAVAEATFKI